MRRYLRFRHLTGYAHVGSKHIGNRVPVQSWNLLGATVQTVRGPTDWTKKGCLRSTPHSCLHSPLEITFTHFSVVVLFQDGTSHSISVIKQATALNWAHWKIKNHPTVPKQREYFEKSPSCWFNNMASFKSSAYMNHGSGASDSKSLKKPKKY